MFHKHLQDLTILKTLMDQCTRPDPQYYLNPNFLNPSAQSIAASPDLQHTYELGLKTIAEGKVGLILCSGLWRKLHIGKSKLIDEPPWELDATLLQVVIEKLKAISNYGMTQL